MKKKISIGLIVIAVLVAVYFILVPTKTADQSETASPAGHQSGSVPPPKRAVEERQVNMERESPVDEEALRLEKMKTAYQTLEDSRKRLRRQLGKIKARSWNLELPDGQAAAITKELTRAYALLKNPPLLGAFRDTEGINKAIRQLDTVHGRLDGIEQQITQARKDR
ncbi:MAG: hypothetical protein ACE5GZ_13115 [Gammaproteobacteria bacterium]